jgi:hypothetical protein
MVLGTAGLPMGRLDLETIVRAPLVVIADPVVAASGAPATLEELAASVTTPSSPLAGFGGGGAALLERPAGMVLAFANPAPDSGLFVWAGRTFLAVVADPDLDVALDAVGELTVSSGRLVVGAPDVVGAWGPDVETADGSAVRARMHAGRTKLGLIVVAHTACGAAPVTVGSGAAAVSFPVTAADQPSLLLAS